MPHSEHAVVRRFIEDAGNFSQSVGFGRAVGQIYAYLFFSPSPCTLDDMTHGLGISKGSASMNIRLLEQLGAVQRVWVKGDRKDYYVGNDYFGEILRNSLANMVGKRLEALGQFLEEADRHVGNGRKNGPAAGHGANGADLNLKFLRSRIGRLREFHRKAVRAWNNPVVRMMLK
jgi:DNA-binding transcriptional regulator GbsR (MarR family)